MAGVEAVVDAGTQPYRGLEALTATAETPGSLVIRGALAAIDEAMVAATPAITADDGGPQVPNREPVVCEEA